MEPPLRREPGSALLERAGYLSARFFCKAFITHLPRLFASHFTPEILQPRTLSLRKEL
jgi:hypothetical protein